jgi:hypothetical protein
MPAEHWLKHVSLRADPDRKETLRMDTRKMASALALSGLIALAGCAHSDWKRALKEDTASSYHRFLREHPSSRYSEKARAHLAFVQLRAKPTREAFQAFSEDFADSGLVDDLRPHVESAFFEQARGIGTPEAYRSFAADFSGGAFTTRAEGNAEYLEHRGYDGDPGALAEFAKRNPQSDFAAEAERTVAVLRSRGGSEFRSVGLLVEVDASTPDADRLRRAFADRAYASYRAAGLDLVPLTGRSDPRARTLAALLVISHREQAQRAALERDSVTQSAIVADTQVTLTRAGSPQPVWQDGFSLRAPFSTQRTESILFAAGATRYWTQFFVPVATWQTRDAARNANALQKPVVAMDAVEGRAVVLAGDGGFQIYDLADPAKPALVADYHRPRDLARFEGVAALGDRIAVFGQDGLELVRLGASGPVREQVYSRTAIGSPIALLDLGSGLLLAGNRGLQWLASGATEPRVLVPKPIRGLARAGSHVLFTDGVDLYSATLAQLQAGRIATDLDLGRAFDPARVRVFGTRALVLGARGVLCFDVSDAARPVLRSRIEMNQVGEVRDAAFLAGRIFLLGDRGLQVLDASGERVVESVDVDPRQLLDAGGRHLVLAGENSLQVVDATPFVASAAAARATAP